MAYNTLDANLDGQITRNEFMSHVNGSAMAANNLFNALDRDGNGVVSANEFATGAVVREAQPITYAAPAVTYSTPQVVSAAPRIIAAPVTTTAPVYMSGPSAMAYNTLDANLDGQITRNEFMSHVNGSAMAANNLFNALDRDGNG